MPIAGAKPRTIFVLKAAYVSIIIINCRATVLEPFTKANTAICMVIVLHVLCLLIYCYLIVYYCLNALFSFVLSIYGVDIAGLFLRVLPSLRLEKQGSLKHESY